MPPPRVERSRCLACRRHIATIRSSTAMTIRFADVAAAVPTPDSLAAGRVAVEALLDRGDRRAALALWDRQRREYDTWSSLVHLRFAQNTADARAKADRDYADRIAPEATEHEVAVKRRLL